MVSCRYRERATRGARGFRGGEESRFSELRSYGLMRFAVEVYSRVVVLKFMSLMRYYYVIGAYNGISFRG